MYLIQIQFIYSFDRFKIETIYIDLCQNNFSKLD